MSKRKVFCALVVFLSLGSVFLFAEGKQEAAGEKYRLNVGMVVTESDPMYKGALEFKKNVEARTKGAVVIGVYPNSLLGDTKDMQEQVKAGANIAVITDAARLAVSVPPSASWAPPIRGQAEEAKKLTTSPPLQGWTDELAAKHGYRVLSFNWYQGARHSGPTSPSPSPRT
jgi:TRAP-type C4-dicarboxylate transport system substrate-binding protein